MRLKKLDCERSTCSGLDGESRLNCNYKCISESCYEEIYGQDQVHHAHPASSPPLSLSLAS